MLNVSVAHQNETYNNIISQNTNTKRIFLAISVFVYDDGAYFPSIYIAFGAARIMINYRLMSSIFYMVELKSLIKLKPKISLKVKSLSMSVVSRSRT